MRIKFKKIIIDKSCGFYLNLGYIPQVIRLYERYSKYLNDDYFNAMEQSEVDQILSLIQKTQPYFWVITAGKDDKFAGFVFLDNLIGNCEILHSAEITTCFLPEFWGLFTKSCAKKFLKYCFKNYGFKKIKASIFPQNSRVRGILNFMGFKREGLLKGETLRNGKLQDVEVFAVTKDISERKIR
jgi:RimJ/RimL family protein N-acetyltransferase